MKNILATLRVERAAKRTELAALDTAIGALEGLSTPPKPRPQPKPQANGRRHGTRKKCQHCGRGFIAHRTNMKYCSNKCSWARQGRVKKERAKAGHPPLAPRTCETCLKVFSPSRYDQKYCSKPCRAAQKNVARDSQRKHAVGTTLIPGDQVRTTR